MLHWYKPFSVFRQRNTLKKTYSFATWMNRIRFSLRVNGEPETTEHFKLKIIIKTKFSQNFEYNLVEQFIS